MHRPSFRAAALAAAALFFIAVGNARADTAQVATDAANQAAQQTAATASTAAPAQTTSTGTNTPAGGAQTGGAASGGGVPPAAGSSNTTVTVPLDPTANVPAAQVEQSPSSVVAPTTDTTPPSSGGSPPPDASQHGTMSTVLASVPVEATKSTPIGGAPALRAPSHPTGGLEQLVPRVERQLRGVQAQINDLQHGLDRGAVPPESRLIRLRSSLQQITPTLLALGSQLDAAGRLSPSLRQHLRSLRKQLGNARASAAELITALRRVGVHGPQLELLLRELESFNTMRIGLGSTLDPSLAPVPSGLGPGLVNGHGQFVLARFFDHLAAAPPQARAADGGAAGAANRGGGDSPSPWSSALGSATASAGGAFSAAGVALLATLLIGFTLPQLRTRLELPRRRRYWVAFLTPLERPG